MKKIITLLTIMLSIVLLTNCEKNDDSPVITKIDYVGFESGFIVGVDPTGTLSQEVTIATSNISSSDRVFNVSVDADLTTANALAYSIPSSVTVPANSNIGTFNVDVIGPNVDPSGNDVLAIAFSSEENGLFLSAPINLNLKQVCPNPELILDITFDSWPEEIYWRIVDSSDNVVFESTAGAFGAYDGLTGGITRPFCLAIGNYIFEIFDQFGDGAGPYTLTYDGNVIFSSDGAYGEGEAIPFTI